MAGKPKLPLWSIVTPLLGWLGFGVAMAVDGGWVEQALLIAALIGSVLAAVHHAEVIAHRLGEPFGTCVVALAVTVIEVGLIVSIMMAGGTGADALPRDTVMAAIMIVLNGVIGACLLIGGLRHGEQAYVQTGVSAALATLATMSVITLVLPNFVTSARGPYYAPEQLAFVGFVSFVLYVTFILVQTKRHSEYFVADEAMQEAAEPENMPDLNDRSVILSSALMVVALIIVVVLAKTLAPLMEASVKAIGAPKALVGVIVAGIVLMPEGMTAIRAAIGNRLQTSLNLALGSVLASIGLTIPVVAALALMLDWKLVLGISPTNTVLLLLTLLVSTLSLSTGRTTIMQGALHLVLFGVFLFMLIVP
jgi:Ca2+:H+ antiporter